MLQMVQHFLSEAIDKGPYITIGSIRLKLDTRTWLVGDGEYGALAQAYYCSVAMHPIELWGVFEEQDIKLDRYIDVLRDTRIEFLKDLRYWKRPKANSPYECRSEDAVEVLRALGLPLRLELGTKYDVDEPQDNLRMLEGLLDQKERGIYQVGLSLDYWDKD